MALGIDAAQWVENLPISSKLIDGLAAIGPGLLTIVIYNNIPARRQSVVEMLQAVSRGFVIVSIKPNNRKPLDRCQGQRILKPPLQKPNAVIQQAINLEVLFYLVHANREVIEELGHDGPRMSLSFQWTVFLIRLGQP